jgi:hypothetical protein
LGELEKLLFPRSRLSTKSHMHPLLRGDLHIESQDNDHLLPRRIQPSENTLSGILELRVTVHKVKDFVDSLSRSSFVGVSLILKTKLSSVFLLNHASLIRGLHKLKRLKPCIDPRTDTDVRKPNYPSGIEVIWEVGWKQNRLSPLNQGVLRVCRVEMVDRDTPGGWCICLSVKVVNLTVGVCSGGVTKLPLGKQRIPDKGSRRDPIYTKKSLILDFSSLSDYQTA